MLFISLATVSALTQGKMHINLAYVLTEIVSQKHR